MKNGLGIRATAEKLADYFVDSVRVPGISSSGAGRLEILNLENEFRKWAISRAVALVRNQAPAAEPLSSYISRYIGTTGF